VVAPPDDPGKDRHRPFHAASHTAAPLILKNAVPLVVSAALGPARYASRPISTPRSARNSKAPPRVPPTRPYDSLRCSTQGIPMSTPTPYRHSSPVGLTSAVGLSVCCRIVIEKADECRGQAECLVGIVPGAR
jgi:hypothetical protein